MQLSTKTLLSRLLTIALTLSLFAQTGVASARSVANAPPKEGKRVTAVIVLFDGVQIIDYSGPWEVFGQAGFEVHSVAEKLDPVTTAFGQKVIPDYAFDNSPKADILLVPGGGGVRKAVDNPRLIKWIQDNAKDANHVMSVCTGALLLARAGLLDGLTATTFHDAIDRLAAAAPTTRVVSDQRYVDNGKVITTAGLSSGIDGALHVVGKILGQGEAQAEAFGLEYTWESDSRHARAAFADRYLPNFKGLEGKIISVEGDRDYWDVKVLISKPESLAKIMELTSRELVSNMRHTKSAVTLISVPTRVPDRSEIEWRFIDDLNRAWVGSVVAELSPKEQDRFIIRLKLTRDKKSG